MTLRFDEPAFLWLLLAIVPVAATWPWLHTLSFPRRVLAILLRSAAIACAALALARPSLVQRQESITVVGVIDASGSVRRLAPGHTPEQITRSFLAAAANRHRGDRVGVVAFDGAPSVMLLPTSNPPPDIGPLETTGREGTSLADAVALGRDLIPANEAGRVVVVTDGDETIGRAASLPAAIPAGRVAVDTSLVPLEKVDDVTVEALDLPATAPPGSIAHATIRLHSTSAATGTVRLRLDGRPILISHDGADTDGLPVSLAEGSAMIRVELPIGNGPVHEYEAVFEASDPLMDRIAENSRARRVVAVPAGRSALVLRGSEDGASPPIASLLTEAGFKVRILPPDALSDDPLWLAGFDLLVLDNISASSIDPRRQQLIADQVQRVGGGLLCLGGPATFGPGGWKGSTLAGLLPVEVEPPTELRRPSAAVIFLIDRSGSMRRNVSGARATQQEVANEAAAMAIESVATRILVGVIAFDSSPSIVVPLQPLDHPADVTREVRSISPDGGTAIGAALQAAMSELERAKDVEQKLIVLLTDGRGSDDGLLLEQADLASRTGVKVTTIGVGDDTDDGLLAQVATTTGGVFHAVRNPRMLPRILVESVQAVNKPLIREGAIPVAKLAGDDFAQLLHGAPALGGLVVVGPARSPESRLEALTDRDEVILARWQAGVGRVAIFTSELGSAWTHNWSQWAGASPFWQELATWTARSPGSAPIAADASVEDGVLRITVEAGAADAIAGSEITGVARSPSGTRTPISLRRVAPRRFQGEIPAAESGAWLAVLSPRGEAGPLPPMLAAAAAPEGLEFARLQSNPEPLAALRTAAAGRDIPIDSISQHDFFSRDGLALGVAERTMTPALLVLAGLLLVCDTAVRRFAVRKRLLAEATTITSARTEETRVLAAERALRHRAAVPAWSPRSADAEGDNAGSEGAESPASATPGGRIGTARPATASVRKASEPPEPAAPAPPSEDEIRRAIEELRAAAAPPKPAPTAPDAGSAKAAETPDGSAEAESSASLEALRRARERSRIFPP